MVDLSKFDYVVAYGIGQYYGHIMNRYKDRFRFDYLCDINWEKMGEAADGIPVISPEKLQKLNNVFVVVFAGNPRNENSIVVSLREKNLPYANVREFLPCQIVTGKMLKKMSSPYCDEIGNVIEFYPDIEESVCINFLGNNNHVKIGKRVSIGRLLIDCGCEGQCFIGDGTEIEEAKFIVTNGKIQLGEDCLVAYKTVIRNHDTHHIFDSKNGERINVSEDVVIGNHVWLGYGATILKGTEIGSNSVVGTQAVVKGKYPKEVIIAGNPANIVRENVCWSKDNTCYYDRKCLSECNAQEAKKYLER